MVLAHTRDGQTHKLENEYIDGGLSSTQVLVDASPNRPPPETSTEPNWTILVSNESQRRAADAKSLGILI